MSSELSGPSLQGHIKKTITDKISYLEAQICKHKAELLEARQTIQRLQIALLAGAYKTPGVINNKESSKKNGN